MELIIQLHKLILVSRGIQKFDRVVALDNGDAYVYLYGNPIGNAPNNQTKVRQITK